MRTETRLAIAAAAATVLTATSLYPLFTSAHWFWLSAGAVIVTLTVGELARRAFAPPAVVLPIELVTLLCYLTAVFAGSEALLVFLPGPEALERLGGLAGRGFDDIQRYAAPVPSFASITLITAGGVGLVAVLVDLLAVRARKPALAGLPLLGLFCVTSAIQQGAGWLPFALAAAGFAVLLTIDARRRLARWGRRVPTGGRAGAESTRVNAPVDTEALAVAGRRIGVTAVAVAVLIPLLIPQLPTQAMSGWLSGLGSSGEHRGIHGPAPMVSLKRELTLPGDAQVLRYTTKDETPAYLRMYALDRFNGRTWTMSPQPRKDVRQLTGDALPDPKGVDDVRTQKVTTRVTVDREVHGLRYLPLPYPPRRVDIKGTWRYDRDTLMVFSRGDSADGRTYTVKSWDLRPTRERLANAPQPPGAIQRRFEKLPDDLPKLVSRLAHKVTKGRKTAYGKAMALQEWFTGAGNFTYSLRVQPGNGSSALVSFLRDRVGYCEQFASAMAVMARAVDIPARVAVGYTAGNQDSGNTWSVSTHDAHSWPELYFDGVGWIRFEPTPAGAGQPSATIPTYAQPPSEGIVSTGNDGASSQQDTMTTTGDDSEVSHARGPNRLAGPQVSTATPPAPNPDGGHVGLLVTLGALVVLLLTAIPLAARRVARWRRWSRARDDRRRAHAAWTELRDDVRDFGLSPAASETPRQLSARLANDHNLPPKAIEALERIAHAEERARYARTPGEYATLRTDSAVVRTAFARTRSLPRRLCAWLFPPSILRIPAGVGARLADSLNWLDSAGARLRARVSRRRRFAE